MYKSSCPRSRPGIASAYFVAAAIVLSTGLLGGCGPADYGAIDLNASKAIAAEKGIGPQAKPSAVKKAQPLSAPSAPAPR